MRRGSRLSFREFRDGVQRVVEDALEQSGYPKVVFEVLESPRPELGDLSVNVAFQLAKKTGEKPQKVAQSIGRNLKLVGIPIIGMFDVHSTGYINFKVNYPELAYRTLIEALTNEQFGSINIGQGRRVLLEHTSVNPNKALHVGHLRNVVVGDSVARLLSFTGYDVQVSNYIDDSGSQVADIIVGFRYLNFPLQPPSGEKFDQYCGDEVYVKVNELYESQTDLLDKRKEILKKMEDLKSEIAQFARKLTEEILEQQLRTCWRIGAIYNLLNFESHILGLKLWDEIFEILKNNGVATPVTSGKLEGCWIIRVEGEEEGEEKVLVRSDGTATYIAKDIPYAAWKLGLLPDRFNYHIYTQQPSGTALWSTTAEPGEAIHPSFGRADRAITVIDVRQSRLQRIITHVLSQVAGKSMSDKYIHLGYEVVSLSSDTASRLGLKAEDKKFLHMSGRKGIYINADDVLDSLYARSYEETKL
jgi:arginyl-tRNA synthetase